MKKIFQNIPDILKVILFAMFCMMCLVTKNVYADDVVYSTEGGTWTKVNDTTFTMDKDGDGTTDVALVKNGNEWQYVFTVADDKATYYGWEENVPSGYEVIGAGTRANPAVNAMTKYSHTPNISDDGTQSGNYANNLNLNDVVNIPGASSLHVVLTYAGESAKYDYVCAWAGSNPSYTASNNSSSAISVNGTRKFGGGTGNTVEFDVQGDTVTFGYKSDGSGCGNGYGYYAVVTGSGGGLKITNKSKTNPAPETGDLTLSKHVIGNVDTNQNFKFNITLSSNNATIQKLISGNQIFGDISFNNGVGVAYVADGNTVKISNLPAGTKYSIEEDGTDNYIIAWSGAGTVNNGKVTGTITANVSANVVCTNTKKPINPDVPDGGTGNLTIKKNVINEIPSASGDFTFNVAFWNLEPDSTYIYDIHTSAGVTEDNITADNNGNADASIELTNKGNATFENLPSGCKYQISEEASDYIASYEISGAAKIMQQRGENLDINQSLTTAKEAISKNDNAVVAFKNTGKETPKETDKVINVHVEKVWNDNNDATGMRPDDITVQLTQDGDVVATAVLDNDTNWQADFTDLDKYAEDGVTEYEYAVNEIDTSGYKSEITHSENGNTKSFTITNTLIDIGNLKVSKTVKGNGADLTQEFPFTVTLFKDGHPIQGTYLLDSKNGTKTGTVVFDESGKSSFNLKNGESIFIKDIPAGAGYTVVEDVASGYTEANGGKYTGTIKKSDTQSVNVVNTYNPSHKMTIKKIVKGNQGDKTKQFKFQMMLTGNGIPGSLAYTKNGKAGTVVVKNGITEFTLGHEDVMVFNEMPAGVKYVITELDGESNGYTVESKNASGTTDKDVEVSFTNTKNVGVPTAAMTNTGVIAGVIMAGVIGIIIAVIAKRKRRRDEK